MWHENNRTSHIIKAPLVFIAWGWRSSGGDDKDHVCFSDTRRHTKGFTISLCFHFLTRFLDLPITCPLWMRCPLQARPFQARHWASLVIATSEHMGLHRPPFIASISCSAPSTWATCIGVTALISTLLFFKIFKPKEHVG